MSKITFKSLNKFNLIMAGLHAVQGLAVVLISDPKKGITAVTTNHSAYDAFTRRLDPAVTRLFDINLAWLVAAFFFMSAAAHLIIATKYRRRYEADLDKGINKARWIEYALSASTMMVGIGLISGIQDFSTLLMLFALTAGMNLMGLVMEVWNQKSKTVNWLSYWIGCGAGIVPWLVVALYLWASSVYGDATAPAFVYAIFGSIFVGFNCFALIMYKQYQRKGKWANYLYGERAYIILSLVAKTLLAWQVYSGVLKP